MHQCQLIETKFGIICVARGHKSKVSFIPAGMKGTDE